MTNSINKRDLFFPGWVQTYDNQDLYIGILRPTAEEREAGEEGRLVGRLERFVPHDLPNEVPLTVPFTAENLNEYTTRHLEAIEEHTIGEWNVTYIRGGEDLCWSYTAIYSFEILADAVAFTLTVGERFDPRIEK